MLGGGNYLEYESLRWALIGWVAGMMGARRRPAVGAAEQLCISCSSG